ncbi:MAG: 3-phosphoshikimate 1-carboxyvinyltransferase [Candidatus Hydrogenedentota bacterium]|nr:MAG: 3-phosphoshikimate 1-carboxyvinyltransferase [Candidatus Hydrogenedentota bacterium]
MKCWRVRPLPGGSALRGTMRVPGDKSISHRALILSGMAGEVEPEIENLLESEDVKATREIIRKVFGGGTGGEEKGSAETQKPKNAAEGGDPVLELDCGNSGTTIRLMMGVLSGRKGCCFRLDGDASLRRRPMERVAAPLRKMGACIETNEGRPPVRIEGRELIGTRVQLSVASAQVKSALLLAGLQATGTTEITSPAPSRDHTERMLNYFGVPVEGSGNGRAVAVRGPASLAPRPVSVPGDISSAAFFLVAAALIPGSELSIENLGLNPTRTGILDCFDAAGVSWEAQGIETVSGEPRGKVSVRAGEFSAFGIAGDLVPRLIDEIPVLALLAAHSAGGLSVFRDAAELRVKESDRIARIAEVFGRIGLVVRTRDDGLEIPGGQSVRGGTVSSGGDHRIAMTAAVAGLVSREGVIVEDVACVETSFPGFQETVERLAPGVIEAIEG